MIRLLNGSDESRARKLLERAPAFNIYMISNMSALGFDKPFCQFWGDFDEAGRLRAILNRYMNGWVIYGTEGSNWRELGRIIDEHPEEAARLQDNPGGIDSLLPYVQTYETISVLPEEMAALDRANFAPAPPPPGVALRRATEADLDALAEFYANADRMKRSRAAIEQPLIHRRIWLAEHGGQVVAAALTNAEVAGMAMVGGVYTAIAWRGRGISKALCSSLCAELMNEGWRPILYWEAAEAGAVYHRLGFHAIGIWRSVRLRRKKA